MGKITTVLFLFLNFMFFGFTADAATQAQCEAQLRSSGGSGCAKSRGGVCSFGVPACNQSNCSKYGHWNGSSCESGSSNKKNGNTDCGSFTGAQVKDGSCVCISNGATVNMSGDVSQCPPQTVSVVGKKLSTLCTERKGSWSQWDGEEEKHCYCPNGGLIDVENDTKTCDDLADSKNKPADASAGPTPSECDEFEKQRTDARACSDAADTAIKECNEQKEGDSGLDMGKQFVAMIGDAMIKSKAGTGASDACAKASLGLTSALASMDAFKTSCTDSFKTCSDKCEGIKKAVKNKDSYLRCLNATPLQQQESVKIKQKELLELVSTGVDACTVTAGKEKSAMETLMGGMANSATQAKICECKQTSANANNCSNIPNAADCLPGGKSYGMTICNAYGNCAMGSPDYATVQCQCARDSTMSICKTAAANPVSNFGGIDTKPATTNGSDFGTLGTPSSSDNFDLGSLNQNKPAGSESDTTPKATNAGLTTSPSGGGGGGGSAPSGGGDGGGAPAGEGGSESGGGGGLFNQIKSALGLGGGGGGNSKTSGSGKNGLGGADLNKWRPVKPRCMGPPEKCEDITGRLNKDIFGAVKDRYQVWPMLDPYLVPTK